MCFALPQLFHFWAQLWCTYCALDTCTHAPSSTASSLFTFRSMFLIRAADGRLWHLRPSHRELQQTRRELGLLLYVCWDFEVGVEKCLHTIRGPMLELILCMSSSSSGS